MFSYPHNKIITNFAVFLLTYSNCCCIINLTAIFAVISFKGSDQRKGVQKMALTISRCKIVGQSNPNKNNKCKFGAILSQDKPQGGEFYKNFSLCEFWADSKPCGLELQPNQTYYITVDVFKDGYNFKSIMTVEDYIKTITD